MAPQSDPEMEALLSETAQFHRPGQAPEAPDLKTAGEVKADADAKKEADAKPDVDAGDQGDGDGDKEGAGGKAEAAAADGGDDKGDEEKKADGEADKPKEGELPPWMKKRVDRANGKESRAAKALREANERARTAEEEAEALRVAAAKTLKKPNPDDFDTVAEYDEAQAAYAAQKAKAIEKKPAAKEPAKDTGLPLGITPDEIEAAVESLDADLPDTISARIKDAKVVPILPAPVLLEIAEEPDEAVKKAMAQFVIGNKGIMAGIGKLAPRAQAAAFVRAFSETQRTTSKKKSDAPEPINRNKGRAAEGAPNLSAMSFAEFEAHENEREAKERGRIW